MLLSATVGENYSRGILFWTIKDTFIDNHLAMIRDLECRGNTNESIRYTCDIGEWI